MKQIFERNERNIIFILSLSILLIVTGIKMRWDITDPIYVLAIIGAIWVSNWIVEKIKGKNNNV